MAPAKPKTLRRVSNTEAMFFHPIGLLFAVLCAICTVIILVDAFKTSALKGFFCLLCWVYYVWYALVEFKHKNKALIVIGSLIGGGALGLLRRLNW